jgi:hypothetical protein
MHLLARRGLAALAVAALGLSLPVAAAQAAPSLTPQDAAALLQSWAPSTSQALDGGFRASLSIAGMALLSEKVTAHAESAEMTGPGGLQAFQHGSRTWIALGSSAEVKSILRYIKRSGRYVYRDQKGLTIDTPVSEFAGISGTPTTDGRTPWITSATQSSAGGVTTLTLQLAYPDPFGGSFPSDMVLQADASGVVSHITEDAGLFDETFAPASVVVHLPSMRVSLPWSVFQKGLVAYEWPHTLHLLAQLFAFDAQLTALDRERDKRVHPSDIWIAAKRDLPGVLKKAPFKTRWVPIRNGVAIISTAPITGKRIDYQVVARRGKAVVINGK